VTPASKLAARHSLLGRPFSFLSCYLCSPSVTCIPLIPVDKPPLLPRLFPNLQPSTYRPLATYSSSTPTPYKITPYFPEQQYNNTANDDLTVADDATAAYDKYNDNTPEVKIADIHASDYTPDANDDDDTADNDDPVENAGADAIDDTSDKFFSYITLFTAENVDPHGLLLTIA